MDTLINALIEVESQGDDNAIGDRTLQYSAYGCLQIRWPLVLDINNRFGTSYRSRQCLGNRALSIELFEKYMSMYATPERLGREVTDEDRARCWNGGIGGMIYRPNPKPKVEAQLQAYWSRVAAIINQS